MTFLEGTTMGKSLLQLELCIEICIYTCTHTHTYTHIRTCIYTHTYTYIYIKEDKGKSKKRGMLSKMDFHKTKALPLDFQGTESR